MSRVTCPTPRRDLSEPKRELSRGGADVSWRGRDMSGIPTDHFLNIAYD